MCQTTFRNRKTVETRYKGGATINFSQSKTTCYKTHILLGYLCLCLGINLFTTLKNPGLTGGWTPCQNLPEKQQPA